MATAVVIKKNLKEGEVNLQNEIASLKKYISDYKIERKLTWKLFKTKINDDLDKVEKSLKKLTLMQKK